MFCIQIVTFSSSRLISSAVQVFLLNAGKSIKMNLMKTQQMPGSYFNHFFLYVFGVKYRCIVVMVPEIWRDEENIVVSSS